MPCTSQPLAMAWPWPRWVEAMSSSGRRWAQTPVAMASSPTYRWTNPGISPVANSLCTRSSNSRMVRIVRYQSRSCSLLAWSGGAVVAIVGPPRDGLVQHLQPAGAGHDGVDVDDERSRDEADGHAVGRPELDLAFPVQGQAAGPGGQGHHLAGVHAPGLQHPDLGDQAGGEGHGDHPRGPLRRGAPPPAPRREADGAGAGEGPQRLGDALPPPQGPRPDPALGGDGH